MCAVGRFWTLPSAMRLPVSLGLAACLGAAPVACSRTSGAEVCAYEDCTDPPDARYEDVLDGELPPADSAVRADVVDVAPESGDSAATDVAPDGADALADAPPPDAGSFDPTCPDVVPAAASGSVKLKATIDDFIALCSGRVLFADKTASRVVLYDAIAGKVLRTYAVAAAPVRLAYEAKEAKVWVAHRSSAHISRLDLTTGAIIEVPTGAPAVSVAVGPAGRVFALLDAAVSAYMHPFAVIDSAKATVVRTTEVELFGRGKVAWDAANAQVFVATVGASRLYRYAYDSFAMTLTLLQVIEDCGNGMDIAVARDGLHLAYACGGGNGAGYTVWDFEPKDLTKHRGEWNTGPYPRGAAFSPNGAWFGASNGEALQLFDVGTFTKSGSVVASASCDYGDLERVQFSIDGKLLLGFSDCGWDADAALFSWMKVP